MILFHIFGIMNRSGVTSASWTVESNEKVPHKEFAVLAVLCEDEFEDPKAVAKRHGIPWQTAARRLIQAELNKRKLTLQNLNTTNQTRVPFGF